MVQEAFFIKFFYDIIWYSRCSARIKLLWLHMKEYQVPISSRNRDFAVVAQSTVHANHLFTIIHDFTFLSFQFHR
jgi:hypothetical protein